MVSTPDGQPNITLDAVNFTTLPTFNAFLFVYASDFTMTRLRIIRVQNHALRIMAGQIMYPPPSPPPEVRNIRIEDNVFDNSSLKDYPLGDGDAIRIWMEPEGIAADASITNVQIVHNTFRHFQGKDAVTGTGVIIVPSGTNCVIRDVVIQGNTFVDTMYPVEVGISQGSNNRVVGTRIFENTFTNGLNPIFIGINVTQDRFASGSVIEDTVIRGNVFFGTLGSVEMVGGHTVGEATNATGNSIINTQIVNNLIVAGNGIHIIGGGPGGSGNRVDGVQVINNTIITYPLAGVHADKNRGNGTENSVTGVSVLNTIIQNREPDKPRPEDVIAGEITPDQVRFSIISTPRFVGVNGNISADPKFVNPNYANPGEGDFHLQPGSPAIDAGTSDGAPSTDLEGHARFDDPSTPNTGEGAIRYYDIGAFEYGSHPALYFPHVATNFPWQTEIAIINTSDQTVTGTLRGLSDEGQLIETKNVTLSARGRRQITIADEFTNHTNIGYIIFDTSSVEVQGYTKFYIAGSYRAAIPAVKEVNTSNIYIPHIASNADWWTGVSLVNTTSAPKVLTITFNNGQSRQITLTANQHRAFD
ncbi:MAG: hypothetical protein NTY86_16780, partial [Deltaproteobacteria bacterium]|nr:hypothetical protein [Deltaproteobacteria bacterium]